MSEIKNEKQYLNEERYQKNKKKLEILAIIVLVIGLLIGFCVIGIGIKKVIELNNTYSEESVQRVTEEFETEKANLEVKKSELEAAIAPVKEEIKSLDRAEWNGTEDYNARRYRIEDLEESIEEEEEIIDEIEAVLSSPSRCGFDTDINTYNEKYCELANQLDSVTSEFDKSSSMFGCIPFFMIGIFIIIFTFTIFIKILSIAKGREILAFGAQQAMPVAKEGIEEMAPTIGKAKATIIKEQAPAYKDLAESIAKGVKDGLKDDDKKS